MSRDANRRTEKHILNILRLGTVAWEGRQECLRLARKKFPERIAAKGHQVYKYHWICSICRQWFRDEKMMEVDHIEEVGPFQGDWNDYIRRLYFCGQQNLQALCSVCHQKKTSGFNATLRYKRKASWEDL